MLNLTYRQLQQAIREFRKMGCHSLVALNSSTTLLQAEYENLMRLAEEQASPLPEPSAEAGIENEDFETWEAKLDYDPVAEAEKEFQLLAIDPNFLAQFTSANYAIAWQSYADSATYVINAAYGVFISPEFQQALRLSWTLLAALFGLAMLFVSGIWRKLPTLWSPPMVRLYDWTITRTLWACYRGCELLFGTSEPVSSINYFQEV